MKKKNVGKRRKGRGEIGIGQWAVRIETTLNGVNE